MNEANPLSKCTKMLIMRFGSEVYLGVRGGVVEEAKSYIACKFIEAVDHSSLEISKLCYFPATLMCKRFAKSGRNGRPEILITPTPEDTYREGLWVDNSAFW